MKINLVNFAKQILKPEKYDVMKNLPKETNPRVKYVVDSMKNNINAVAERTGREPRFALTKDKTATLINMGPYTAVLEDCKNNSNMATQVNKLLTKVTALEYLEKIK